MEKLSGKTKARLAIVSIGLVIGILLLIVVFTIGNKNREMRPFISMLVKIYISCVPIFWMTNAVIRRKDAVLWLVIGGIYFVFCLWFLILPMIF